MKKKPCKECPFRKTSAPGYLGESSYQPQQFLASTEYNLLPCHMKVVWSDVDDDIDVTNIAEKSPCIGMLQLMNNQCKFPRGAREPGAYQKHLDTAGTNPDVFKWSFEFIEHHSPKKKS